MPFLSKKQAAAGRLSKLSLILSECRLYMQRAAEGSPVRESPVLPILLVSARVMFITFLIVANAWLRMNNVAKAVKANNYIAGSLVLTGQSDTFTHRTETKRKIQSSSSGGGSRSRSGGGGSGRSGSKGDRALQS